MSRTLYVHPSPALLRRRAQEHLGQTPPAFTLIPNLAAGRSLRQLTRQALPTITFGQQARRSLSRAGWRSLPPEERGTRLRELLTRLNLEYFGALLERPSTVDALADVIQALLRSDASRLPPGRSARERDLTRLHRQWVLELLRDECYDAAVPEFFAARTSLAAQPLLASGFAYLDAAQIAYLDRLAAPGSAMYLSLADGSALSEARRTADALVARGWQLEEVAEDDRDGRRLQRPGDLAARRFLMRLPQQVPVYTLPGVVEEVREALRQIKRAHLEENRAWRELALVVRDEARYLPVLSDVAREYGIPLCSSARMPLRATALGGLIQAWTEAGLRGWPFALTQRLLTHPLLNLPFDPGQRMRSFGRRSPSGLYAWSSDPVTAGFDLPESATGLAFLQHLTETLARAGVLERQRAQPELGAALAVMNRALQPLAALPLGPRAHFLSAVSSALELASVPMLPGLGGVRIMTPLGTLGRSFQAVWVLGVADGVFPRPASDPPLLDAQLRAHYSQTGVYLPGGVESQAIESALFFHALACGRERVTLTRPETLTGGKPARPSAFLQGFGNAAPPAELHAGSEHEAAVQFARLRQPSGDATRDERIRALAEQERVRERGQESGPLLPGAVDPDEHVWSASQLHAYGACRYQWFAKRVLQLRVTEPPLQGLDPRATGTLYHLTLEKLLRPYLGLPAPAADELAAHVPAHLDQAAAQLVEQGEIDTGPLWHVQRQVHVQLLQQAVRAPAFLPEGHTVHALEQPVAGQVPVGDVFWNVRGYADRVDRTPGGQLVVTDYKLSKYISHVRGEDGLLTLEVQLPIYLTALPAQTGRYYSLKHAKVLQEAGTGATDKAYDADAHARQVQLFLAQARQDLKRGDFRALPDPARGACTYCEVAPLCRVRQFSTTEDE